MGIEQDPIPTTPGSATAPTVAASTPSPLFITRVARTPGRGRERHRYRAYGTGFPTSLCGDAGTARDDDPNAPDCAKCAWHVLNDVSHALDELDTTTTRRLAAAVAQAAREMGS